MAIIAHKFRRIFRHGGSLVITLPAELDFSVGDDAAWDLAEDGTITLKRISVDTVALAV